jgi:hypothetical protein
LAAPLLPPIVSPFRLSIGLRRIDPAAWITVDEAYGADLVERERVLAAHFDEVVQCVDTDDAREACRELLDLLVDALEIDGQGLWRRGDDGSIAVGPTGWSFDPADPDDHLTAVAHLVADDLCVLDGEALVLVAGAVCFPNRWRLGDKLGHDIVTVHDPVPGFRPEMGDPVRRVLTKLRPGKVVERRNWSLLTDVTLYQPEAPAVALGAPTLTAANAGEHVWVRVERQTLRRLPETGVIVFGIRTLQRRLAEVGSADRDALATAVEELPQDMAAYKSIDDIREPVLAWLRGARGR